MAAAFEIEFPAGFHIRAQPNDSRRPRRVATWPSLYRFSPDFRTRLKGTFGSSFFEGPYEEGTGFLRQGRRGKTIYETFFWLSHEQTALHVDDGGQ